MVSEIAAALGWSASGVRTIRWYQGDNGWVVLSDSSTVGGSEPFVIRDDAIGRFDIGRGFSIPFAFTLHTMQEVVEVLREKRTLRDRLDALPL